MEFNYSIVDSAFKKKLESESQRLSKSLESRLQGSVTPNAVLAFGGIPRDQYSRLGLAISSWWLGDVGILLRLEIEKSQDLRVNLACSSKAAALEILFNNFHPRDFFGNLLPRILRLLSRLQIFQRIPRKAIKTIRRRGYRDHGSQTPEHCKHRDEPDDEFNLLQNQIDKEKQILDDTEQFILGLLGVV